MWDDLIGENLAVADPVNQTRSLIDRIGIGAIPWNTQGPDLSGVIGSNADYQNKIANSTVPYFMGIRPQATNVLGYQGSFMGGSRGYTDDSAGQAWDQAANRNVEIQRMLGNQAVARQSNANDMMRTMMAVDQRRENSRMMGQSRFDQLLGKTAKGKRGELADTGEREGFLSPDAAGSMRIEDAMYNSLAGNANKGVVNIPRFLAGLQKNFDPKRMDINGLVEQLKAAGIDPNSIRQYADDPNVGAFAKSLLGPDVPVLKPLSRMVRSLQDTIYGGGTAAPPSDMDKFKASLPDWSKYTPQQTQQPQSAMQWLQSLLY